MDTPPISTAQSTVFRNADVPAGTANTSRPDTASSGDPQV
ncbi:hypothetical protein Rhow_008760 [Rhodococcus wratislaviensis]|uniref:Uncharacterized protein n=1 Tax=Rhodococcus wratislaviensis TaxID=44752 RepID=A0A402CLD7_RHOWR|nr:hypothetical protein Rhow_008760 [Rhodococcus wratislaviensis]